MNRFDIRLSMMILVLLVALVAGWSGPALAAGGFIECMHGCYAQWRGTIENECYAFPCRYLPSCTLTVRAYGSAQTRAVSGWVRRGLSRVVE